MLSEMVLALGLAGSPRPGAHAAAVLHAWDDRRAAAWAEADPAALRALYAPGSATGRADAAMLRAWSDRGLRVTGMRTQLLRVVVRHASSGRLDLVVTDRLAAGQAVGPGWGRALPHDAPTTRRLTLVRLHGHWRVSEALDLPP